MRDIIDEEEKFLKKMKIDREKYKEKILDQIFLKAQSSRSTKKKSKIEFTKPRKKPFIRSGIVIIFIAIFLKNTVTKWYRTVSYIVGMIEEPACPGFGFKS